LQKLGEGFREERKNFLTLDMSRQESIVYIYFCPWNEIHKSSGHAGIASIDA
jgi:hypothetical protein